jgi:hypothetical protein
VTDEERKQKANAVVDVLASQIQGAFLRKPDESDTSALFWWKLYLRTARELLMLHAAIHSADISPMEKFLGTLMCMRIAQEAKFPEDTETKG